MSGSYDGPIVDAHHHLWDIGMQKHAWILSDAASMKPVGDVRYLRTDYGLSEYKFDIADSGIVSSVHVEALWDRSSDPVEETNWLESLPRDGGRHASRYVAFAALGTPNSDEILDRHASCTRVAGVRETIRRHPDPARAWQGAMSAADPAWRRGVERLDRYRLVLELLIYPQQATDVAELARDFPNQKIVVNHVASPVDRDTVGIERWRSALRIMAREPNIAIKLSNFAYYAGPSDIDGQRGIVMRCIDAFGSRRCIFGSDYPVARRVMPLRDMCFRMKEILAELSKSDQRAIFHDNAVDYYRMS